MGEKKKLVKKKKELESKSITSAGGWLGKAKGESLGLGSPNPNPNQCGWVIQMGIMQCAAADLTTKMGCVAEHVGVEELTRLEEEGFGGSADWIPPSAAPVQVPTR